MKVNSTAVIVALVFSTSCMFRKEVFVESDHRINTDFKSFKSYQLVTQEPETEENVVLEEVDRAIQFEMGLHGYKHNEIDPGLLVLYRVFDKDFKFTGNQDGTLDDEQNAAYKPIKYKLKKGTLMIQIVDMDNNQLVWQGYASGVVRNHNHVNPRELKRAVLLIFNKYQYFAEGYLTAR